MANCRYDWPSLLARIATVRLWREPVSSRLQHGSNRGSVVRVSTGWQAYLWFFWLCFLLDSFITELSSNIVEIDSSVSPCTTICTGIPQGFVLDPHLFVFFWISPVANVINPDLSNANKHIFPTIYRQHRAWKYCCFRKPVRPQILGRALKIILTLQ